MEKATALSAVGLLLFAGCGEDAAQKQGREQLAREIADRLSAIHERAQHLEFAHARKMLQEAATIVEESPYANVALYEDLKAQIEAAYGTVAQQERDYKRKCRAGWAHFEGRFISAEEKQGILDQRSAEQQRDQQQAQAAQLLALRETFRRSREPQCVAVENDGKPVLLFETKADATSYEKDPTGYAGTAYSIPSTWLKGEFQDRVLVEVTSVQDVGLIATRLSVVVHSIEEKTDLEKDASELDSHNPFANIIANFKDVVTPATGWILTRHLTPKPDGPKIAGHSLLVTYGKYEIIQTGMSVEDVEEVMGWPGTEMESEHGVELYRWESADNVKAITVGFINGKVSTKNQEGLLLSLDSPP